jgi:hypothetical protein
LKIRLGRALLAKKRRFHSFIWSSVSSVAAEARMMDWPKYGLAGSGLRSRTNDLSEYSPLPYFTLLLV